MAQLLRPTNFDNINIAERTELSADVAASQKIANVLSSQGIEANNYYVLGKLGGELSELAQVDSVTGNAITAEANYTQAHKKGDAVTKLFGNKIKLYRAANIDGSIPVDGDFSLLTTIDIEVDQQYTEYNDSTGSSSYWYKKTYFNSFNSSESSLADAVAIRGGNYGNYVTPEEVQGEAGLSNNKWIPNSVYQDKLVKAQSEVNTSLRIGKYTLPLSVVPQIVKNATLLIAAGYVLLRDYGPENTGTNKEGERKLAEGRKLLAIIEKGGDLTGDDGTPITNDSTGRVNGFPTDNEYPTAPMFSITDKF